MAFPFVRSNISINPKIYVTMFLVFQLYQCSLCCFVAVKFCSSLDVSSFIFTSEDRHLLTEFSGSMSDGNKSVQITVKLIASKCTVSDFYLGSGGVGWGFARPPIVLTEEENVSLVLYSDIIQSKLRL